MPVQKRYALLVAGVMVDSHPDKVAHLAKDLQELARAKAQENSHMPTD
jgi:hypothetical protein